jgi:hypothetical protein
MPHRLTGADRNPEFEAFFTDHIRKLLLVRRAGRYLSKGNYNVTRIEYLSTVFPDARFIIPIRHPLTHVASLMRQHTLFSDYARQDPRVPRYLAAAGHYEFGPQRVPIRLSSDAGDMIQAAWDAGDDAAGYAIQWAEIYRFVDALQVGPESLAQRILVVRHEDFCQQPREVLHQILGHIGHDAAELGLRHFGHISAAKDEAGSLSDERRGSIWQECEFVAARFGYAWPAESRTVSEQDPALRIAWPSKEAA